MFSLILALVSSPIGATKRELLSSVHGYSEDFAAGGDTGALERKFERDKGELRRLGIPLETLDSPEEPGNNQLLRYRISKERLQIPESLRFTAAELTMLRLAALAWRDGSLSAEARHATMKLEALGAALDVRHLGVAPRVGIPEPAAPDLQRAIDERRVVSFYYQHPDHETALGRKVAPLRLHRADGRWHLIGWDLERAAERVFLLSRIEGQVRVEREASDLALFARVESMVAELEQLQRERTATVDARIGSAAEARLSPRSIDSDHAVDGWVRLTLGMLDAHVLADELTGYGADAAVVGPGELRLSVIERLKRVGLTHRPSAADSPLDEEVSSGIESQLSSEAREVASSPVKSDQEGDRHAH